MNIVKFIAGFFLLSLFASCSINEEIDLSKKGAGYYTINMDMSQAIEMMKGMGGGGAPDSLKDKKIDSTISLAMQIDSLNLNLTPEERAYFEKGTMHISMDMAENKMTMEMKYPVKDIRDLAKFFKVYQKVDSAGKAKKKEQQGEEAPSPDMGSIGSPSNMFTNMPSMGTPYVLTDSTIQRIAVTKEAMQQVMGEEMKGAEMFMAQMTLTITLKLPRDVKETKGDMIKVLDDKRTVVFSGSFADMVADPAKSEFFIKF